METYPFVIIDNGGQITIMAPIENEDLFAKYLDLSPLNNLVSKDKLTELKKRFDKVMSLKDFDVNNVPAGREYVEAYVQYFHFAEGEGEHNHNHSEVSGHLGHVLWVLSGIFLIISVWFGILYYRKK